VSGSEHAHDEPEAAIAPGTVVDEYVVEELFSLGPGSAVYRSRQPSLGRAVALKLLPRKRSGDRRWVDQFRRSAQILAQISHPNIVPVYGVGTYAGREFLAMMFVPGGKSLDRAYPAPQSEAALAGLLKAAADVARALAFVHEQGLVHGDVKPSNLLVAPNGHAYLIDFDFATKRGERRRTGLEEDRSSGFLPPVPPDEQAQFDHRVDVYGLGATLFCVLTGSPPRGERGPSIDAVRSDLPKPVCALIQRCLSTDPRTRFHDANEVADGLVEMVETLVQPGPGRALGPFDIRAEVGRGGMGVVYRALQQPLGREVALKVLPPEFTALPSRVKRFQREAEAVSKLDHAHIVPLYAFGKAGGYHYFAMKFVRGSTLAAIIERMRGRRKEGIAEDAAFAMEFPSVEHASPKEGSPNFAASDTAVDARPEVAGMKSAPAKPREEVHPTPASSDDPAYVRDMTRVFVSVAAALAHAHEQGILHRDVKPANIILEEGGHPYVLDFGLARDQADLGLTDSGGFVGTPYYMAPEQIRRDEAHPVDRRTDVWGLGVTMYETLALRRPFKSQNADELFGEILAAEPIPLRRMNSGVSKELEAVVSKALTRDPLRRYQSMHELRADLESALAGGPVSAHPVSAIQHLVSSARKHRVPTGAVIVGAFVLALGLILLARPISNFLFGPPAQGNADGGPPAVTSTTTPLGAHTLPTGVAVVIRIFENPDNPAEPSMQVLPAIWLGGDVSTAVFPQEDVAPVHKGFDAHDHGKIVWVLPEARLPLALDDPATYQQGAGATENLARFKDSLKGVHDALKASKTNGMLDADVRGRGGWIRYKLRAGGSPEGAPTDVPDFLPGASFPVDFVEFRAKGRIVGAPFVGNGNFTINKNLSVQASLGETAKDMGGVILDKTNRVIGYLRKRGYFTKTKDLLAGG
jgi:serine/threonine protein kinase